MNFTGESLFTWFSSDNWSAAFKLWEPLGGGGNEIVAIPSLTPSTDDPATGMGELRACAIALASCIPRGIRQFTILSPDELVPFNKPLDMELLRHRLGAADVILLGGSLSNRVTAQALGLLVEQDPSLANVSGRAMDHHGRENHWIAHRSFRNGEKLFTDYSDELERCPQTMIADYGAFIVRRNCFSAEKETSRRIFIFFGAHTYGTQAAADFFFTPTGAARLLKVLEGARSNWRNGFDGLVRVSPFATEEKEEVIPFLSDRNRVIDLLYPAAAGMDNRRTRIVNPALADFFTELPFSFLTAVKHYVRSRFFGFCGCLLFVVGLYLHSWNLAISGIMLFLLSKATPYFWFRKRIDTSESFSLD